MAMDTDSTLCFECGKPAAGQLVCSGCGVVQHGATEEPDFFALFALPRRLSIDLADLEARYYALSRELHPDLFQTRSPAEQVASLRATALVNRAYRTLRDPVRRALYWLTIHGEALGRNNDRVPAALATQVFEVQEQLEELRERRQTGAAAAVEGEVRESHALLRRQMRALEERLQETFARADRSEEQAASLAETKALLSELHYLRTLIRDVEQELEPEWSAS